MRKKSFLFCLLNLEENMSECWICARFADGARVEARTRHRCTVPQLSVPGKQPPTRSGDGGQEQGRATHYTAPRSGFEKSPLWRHYVDLLHDEPPPPPPTHSSQRRRELTVHVHKTTCQFQNRLDFFKRRTATNRRANATQSNLQNTNKSDTYDLSFRVHSDLLV